MKSYASREMETEETLFGFALFSFQEATNMKIVFQSA